MWDTEKKRSWFGSSDVFCRGSNWIPSQVRVTCHLFFWHFVYIQSYTNNLILYRKKITYCCVYDDPDLGVAALSEPWGHPNQLSVDLNIHGDIVDLREELTLDNKTKLVHLLSFSTNEMIKQTMMYPEVYFMDCTGRANHQKRDSHFCGSKSFRKVLYVSCNSDSTRWH